MPTLSPDQEREICDALIRLGWLETQHALHMEGVCAIPNVLQCSAADAIDMLRDLRERNLIEMDITRGMEVSGDQHMPIMQLRWIRPPTHK